ncbi:ABC transporter ATP-binding protein [Taibaiella lutea]|uniref:ABC transporter ATP-binding protein n=1 Tax=Taibaiella lutea TaxID=2608001 RepID=A0A5M6CHF9_9BACT|nr:ABC transporter ATP-binding protein [Taibaiella lutea]KAA5533362.1 ABC transporter ATP-binding protein [Taibaiella lutea]
MSKPKLTAEQKAARPNLLHLLKPYKGLIAGLLLFALLSNALTLVIPKLIQIGIDDYTKGSFSLKNIVIEFSIASVLIFVLLYAQSILQTYASEKVARNLRKDLSAKISQQSFIHIQEATPAKLLTNLTSDVDAIKMFVSQAIVSIVSSIVLIIGTAVLLVSINVKLGLMVLLIIPIIGVTFMVVFKKVKVLFKKGQEVIDWLNKVINESIIGAALIRVLNAQSIEYNKFMDASLEAKNLGMSILRLFALLIPVIVFTANMARLAVVAIGGHYVINKGMTLGDFAAFSSYISILIFPILMIGFMSNVIARASASYGRIHATLHTPGTIDNGTVTNELQGNIELKDITITYGEKAALKDVSFKVDAKTRTAIIGPTAAGKSQLLYLLTTLIKPDKGAILYDNILIDEYKQEALLSQIGLAFQDSIIFNMSVRENIAFNANVTEAAMNKAIETAELGDFIETLPEKLETIISERGNSLSGGQKQRVMLARALAIEPRILLLDDFTARVDNQTEQKILANLKRNYPGITLLSITQKIASAKDFDQIILLMEGELIAKGTHETLMKTCPEYIQIYDSQQSLEASH